MSDFGLNREKVQAMLTDLESEQIERTISTADTDKFAQAICAFSNDLSNTSRNGYLFIGVHDNGIPCGLKASDRLLQSLGGLRVPMATYCLSRYYRFRFLALMREM